MNGRLPSHDASFQKIKEALSEWRILQQEYLNIRNTAGFNALVAMIITAQETQLNDRIHHQIREMVEEEKQTLLLKKRESLNVAKWSLISLPAEMLFLIVLLCAGILRLNAEIDSNLQNSALMDRKTARFKTALEKAGIGEWTVNLVNQSSTRSVTHDRIFGYPDLLPEWSREKFLEHVHPDDREKARNAFLVSLEKGDDWHFECRIIRRDGSQGWIWCSGTLVRDEFNVPVEMIGMVGDLTERFRIQERIALSEARLRLATEAADIGIWEWDVATNRIRWDRMMFQIYGMKETPDGFINYDDWKARVHPSDLAEQEKSLQHLVQTRGRNNSRDFRIIRDNDRATRMIRAAETALSHPGWKTSSVIGINLDISESVKREEKIRTLNASLQERARQLEVSNQEMEAFSYSVSHDLRAPLRAADGFSRILEEDYGSRLDEEGRRIIGVIRSETQRMGNLIDDLLAFSRLGRQKVEITSIDMTAMVAEVFKEISARDPGRKVELNLHELPVAIGVMPMIRQMWINLIGNAIKFTKGREIPRIEIGTESSKEGTTGYFIRDNGIGFDMKYLDKLFGVFQRLHSSEEFPGTGIGLALVKRIIERHGGRVWAEGEVNKGATFHFTISTQKTLTQPA